MYFVIYKGTNNAWYWTLYASNHAKIADSAEGYWNKQDCLHGIDLVRSASAAPVYER